jgi:hypothetical protein
MVEEFKNGLPQYIFFAEFKIGFPTVGYMYQLKIGVDKRNRLGQLLNDTVIDCFLSSFQHLVEISYENRGILFFD